MRRPIRRRRPGELHDGGLARFIGAAADPTIGNERVHRGDIDDAAALPPLDHRCPDDTRA